MEKYEIPNAMLTGSDLLNRVKELGDISKTDLARGCGYVSTKKDGGERVNFTAFYEALLQESDSPDSCWRQRRGRVRRRVIPAATNADGPLIP